MRAARCVARQHVVCMHLPRDDGCHRQAFFNEVMRPRCKPAQCTAAVPEAAEAFGAARPWQADPRGQEAQRSHEGHWKAYLLQNRKSKMNHFAAF